MLSVRMAHEWFRPAVMARERPGGGVEFPVGLVFSPAFDGAVGACPAGVPRAGCDGAVLPVDLVQLPVGVVSPADDGLVCAERARVRVACCDGAVPAGGVRGQHLQYQVAHDRLVAGFHIPCVVDVGCHLGSEAVAAGFQGGDGRFGGRPPTVEGAQPAAWRTVGVGGEGRPQDEVQVETVGVLRRRLSRWASSRQGSRCVPGL